MASISLRAGSVTNASAATLSSSAFESTRGLVINDDRHTGKLVYVVLSYDNVGTTGVVRPTGNDKLTAVITTTDNQQKTLTVTAADFNNAAKQYRDAAGVLHVYSETSVQL